MPVLAVAALAVEIIAIALMALLLTYALDLLSRGIAQVIPGWSIPGLGSLRNAIISGINGTIGTVKSLAQSSLQGMVYMLRDPITFFQAMYNAIYAPVNELAATCYWIIVAGIPRALTPVIQYSQQLYNQSISYATTGLAQLRTYAEQLYNRSIAAAAAGDAIVHQYATDVSNAVERDARAIGAEANTYAQQLAGQVQAYAQQLATQVAAQATAGVTSAFQHADALAVQVEADAHALAQGAINHADAAASAAAAAAIATVTGPLVTDLPGLWPGVVDGIDGIIDAAGDGFSDAIGAIRDIDLAVPVSIGGALAIALPAVTALSRLAKDCTIPNCRNLSGVGRELQQLFGIVEDGLLLAFIAELVHDPAGGVTLVENTLGTLARDAVDAGRSLLGV